MTAGVAYICIRRVAHAPSEVRRLHPTSHAYRQQCDTKSTQGPILHLFDQSVTRDQLIVNPLVVLALSQCSTTVEDAAGRLSRGVHGYMGRSATSARLARSFRVSE